MKPKTPERWRGLLKLETETVFTPSPLLPTTFFAKIPASLFATPSATEIVMCGAVSGGLAGSEEGRSSSMMMV